MPAGQERLYERLFQLSAELPGHDHSHYFHLPCIYFFSSIIFFSYCGLFKRLSAQSMEATRQGLMVHLIVDSNYFIKTNDMKKAFLLALAGALTISSFAADHGKIKGKKHKKGVKTEQTCPRNCPKSHCEKM